MIGTASHPINTAAITAIRITKYFGKLLFTERFLNLKAINGSLLIMSRLTINIMAYKNHLFSNKLIIASLLDCSYMSGKLAINKPTAGTGTPLNPVCIDEEEDEGLKTKDERRKINVE